MRHLILFLLLILITLGLAVTASGATAVQAVSDASASGVGLEALRFETISLQPLPEAPLIANVAADTCSNATTISLNGSGVGDTTQVNDKTEGVEDPVLSCVWGSPNRPQGYRTVWYRFTAESNARVTIDTSNNFNPNSYDTILAVYTGTCGATTLEMVTCNDDYQGFASRVSFNVAKDVTYFVEVADWNESEPGPLELDIFFVVNPIQSKWQSQPAVAPARTHHTTVKRNGLIYLLGGQTNATGAPELSNTVHRYDPASDSWVTLANVMPGDPLTDITAVQMSGNIFVPGGYNGNNMVTSHKVYNIASGIWEPDRAALPVGVGWSQAVALPDGAGYYLIGGISNTDFFTDTAAVHNEVWFFSRPDNEWGSADPTTPPDPPDMTVPRYGHTAVWVNNGLYVVGGIDDNNQLLPGGEYYQPAGNGQWDPLPPLNIARYGAGSAVSPDGKWYVFGGQDFSNTAVSEVELFDPQNPGAGWQILDVTFDLGGSSSIRARAFPHGQFIGNYLYAIGGHDTTDFFVTPLVQRLLVLNQTELLPAVHNGPSNVFNDNFSVARQIKPNVAQIHQFDDSFDFFDAFYFDQLSLGNLTVRLSQIPSGSDYNVTVYDGNKSLRGSSSLAGNQDEAVALLLPTGRYYIMVERVFGPSDGSNYRIIVEK